MSSTNIIHALGILPEMIQLALMKTCREICNKLELLGTKCKLDFENAR